MRPASRQVRYCSHCQITLRVGQLHRSDALHDMRPHPDKDTSTDPLGAGTMKMAITTLYDKYFRVYLDNPEKPYLRTRFIGSAGVYVVIIVIQSLRILPETLVIINGSILTCVCILLAYGFGYLGLAVCLASLGFGMTMILRQWLESGEPMALASFMFLLCTLIASALLSFFSERDRNHQKRLGWLSVVDELTEVHNYRYFQQRLDEEISRAKRSDGLLGMIMMDIDHFKTYNDTYGHRKGDDLLKSIGALLVSTTRTHDVCFRLGGDEFAVLLPDTDLNETTQIGERIRKTVSESTGLGVSVGCTVYPILAGDRNQLMEQADSALYHVKHSGRNKVEAYRDALEKVAKIPGMSEGLLIGSFKTLLAIASASDRYTLGHSERVSSYAVDMGRALGIGEDRIQLLRLAGLLHDIGKIEVPEAILNKRGILTSEEMCIIQKHPLVSAEVLAPLEDLKDDIGSLVKTVRHHHERYDGAGYPDRLQGDDIMLEARILAVCDAYDAMLSDRPYRESRGTQGALEELHRHAGTQFDPELVDVFVSLLGNGSRPTRLA